MPVSSGSVPVGTAATLIDTTDVMPWRIRIHNNDNTDAMFIGGPDVTTTTGMKLEKLQEVELEMQPNDRVYAVSTKTGHNVSFLKITKVR